MFEGQDFQDLSFGTSSAKSVTVSFYAKSSSQNNNHQYGVQLRCRSGSTTQYVSQAFTVTSSWQRFTMTFVGNTGVAIRNDTSVGFEICFHLASGPDDIVSAKSTWTTSAAFQTVTGQSNFMDNTSNEFYLTGVQLEVGDTATSFEHRSIGEELYRCQRYYFKFCEGTNKELNVVWYFTGSHISFFLRYPTTMRAAPTLSITTGTNYYINYRNGGNDQFDGFASEFISTEQMSCFRNSQVSGTAGQAGILRTNNSAAKVEISAEL